MACKDKMLSTLDVHTVAIDKSLLLGPLSSKQV
jgi:hypothetical protein